MHLPGLHSNSVSLHCFDPFDRNRFIIFHSRNHSFARLVAVRARTEANKSETNLANDLSAHQFISRDIKLGSSEPVSISRYNFLRRIRIFSLFSTFLLFLSFFLLSFFSFFFFFNRRNERRFAGRFLHIKLKVQR